MSQDAYITMSDGMGALHQPAGRWSRVAPVVRRPATVSTRKCQCLSLPSASRSPTRGTIVSTQVTQDSLFDDDGPAAVAPTPPAEGGSGQTGAASDGGGRIAARPAGGRRRQGSKAATSEAARLLDTLRAFVAPVATDASAVSGDERVLAFARELIVAFSSRAERGSQTKAEILYALRQHSPELDERFFESRFTLFVEMGLLQPNLIKKHQVRYNLNPAGYVGLLALERLGVRGGIDELLHLLGTTRLLLENGHAARSDVLGELRTSRQLLQVFAAELARLIETAPIGELIGVHTEQDPHNVTDAASALNDVVTARFAGDHEVSSAAFDLLEAALEYRGLVMRAVERVLEQGGTTLDFSVLSPEQYLTAAIDADVTALGCVGTHLVTDPPMLWPHPGVVLEALDAVAPRRRNRQRPPEPHVPDDPDPLSRLAERSERARRQRRSRAESRLQGGDHVDLTSFLRDAGWPGAATALIELLALAHDPDEPFQVTLAEGVLIDPDAPVTYLHPAELRRTAPPCETLLVEDDTEERTDGRADGREATSAAAADAAAGTA